VALFCFLPLGWPLDIDYDGKMGKGVCIRARFVIASGGVVRLMVLLYIYFLRLVLLVFWI
jgi:hypothetical protein